MARESPTRIRSTPASSAMRAPGASYAVTMTSGSAPGVSLRARMLGAVIAAAMVLPLLSRPTPRGCRRCPTRYRDGMALSQTCESCGRGDEELAEVRRVYITPAAWDTEERIEVVTDTEMWCFVCRTHYPHQPVGDDQLE